MNWNTLTDPAQLDLIVQESETQPVLIFKHSTTCSISATAKNRLERQWSATDDEIKTYYLDLLANRAISNQIAERFGVRHESPQLLLIQDGICTYHGSHMGINLGEVKKRVSA